MADSAVAFCEMCGTPLRVFFTDEGQIEKVLAPCRCPRPTPDEANVGLASLEQKEDGWVSYLIITSA